MDLENPFPSFADSSLHDAQATTRKSLVIASRENAEKYLYLIFFRLLMKAKKPVKKDIFEQIEEWQKDPKFRLAIAKFVKLTTS